MADARALKEQLEEMAAKMVSEASTTPDALRFLFLWKAHAAAVAEERADSLASAEHPRPTYVPRPKGPKPFDAIKAEILDSVAGVLTAGGPFPMKTGEIFGSLPFEIMAKVPGNDPKSNLSAMMHNSKRFISHGRAGWTLPEADQPPTVVETEEIEEAIG